MQKYIDPEMLKRWQSAPNVDKFIKSTQQGAATTAWAAVAREWERHGREIS